MMGFVKVSREIYKLINQTIAQKGHHPFLMYLLIRLSFFKNISVKSRCPRLTVSSSFLCSFFLYIGELVPILNVADILLAGH